MRQERYVRWRAVRDGRTCPLCWDLHGEILDTYDRTWDARKPPRHMYCRCSTQPIALEDLPVNLRIGALAPRPPTWFEPWKRERWIGEGMKGRR